MAYTIYTVIKTVHVTCALVAYLLFFSRGFWMFSDPKRLEATWVRVVPHVVDSLLLVSAIGLVVVTHQYPGALTWLNVKIVCLVLYIGLGMAAFRFCKTRRSKLIAWVLAQTVFLYIAIVAVTQTPYLL